MTAASAIRVFRADDHRARAVGVMSLNHTDGPPPIERMTPPSMIADFEAHGVVGEDRMWRLQSDVIRPISSVIVRLRSLSTCNGRNGARGISGARRQDAGLRTSAARSLMDYNGHVNITKQICA
jgi:hypothetical protein